ncbi:MAG: hypothetical protein CMK64_04280 [Pseudoalteromonas sp.]|nr:hypothetical protein [Pseudoalteromonas sp.]
MATLSCKIYVVKQGYFYARATSDRNEVSQHKEVRVWIPDGRSYMDVKQHYIQNFIYGTRSKTSVERKALDGRTGPKLHGCKTTQHPELFIYSARSKVK